VPYDDFLGSAHGPRKVADTVPKSATAHR